MIKKNRKVSTYKRFALPLLVLLLIGLSAWNHEEAGSTTHTVTIDSWDCSSISPFALDVDPGDTVVFEGNTTASVSVNHPALTETTVLSVPGSLAIKGTAPEGTYEYDVSCGGSASPETPNRPGVEPGTDEHTPHAKADAPPTMIVKRAST